MEIESYKVLDQLKLRLTTLVEQSIDNPNASTGQLDEALFNVFYELKADLLRVLQRDLAKVVPVDLALRNEES